MKSPGQRWIGIALATGLVVALGLGIGLWFKQRPTGPEPEGKGPPALTGISNTTALAAAKEAATRQLLAQVAARLESSSNAPTARQLLDSLRQALSELEPGSASALIREFLKRGQDASTKMEFAVGAHGWLDSASTLRVWLLDELAKVDRAGAATYARTILENAESPDEWAVALRNLALGDTSPDARALLQEKIGQMLRHEPWQQKPSVGYLEAFDVAVHLGGTNLVPALSALAIRKDNAAVAHAAHLALDRLTIQAAAPTLELLQAQPELMRGRELARADLFARVDARDPKQRQVLESYLLDPARGDAELNQFASVYPNANFRISQNLLTPTATPDSAALAARDASALRVVNEWLADARFAARKPHLEKIRLRLETFVREAGRNR